MSDDREQNTIYTQENPSRQNQPLESFDFKYPPSINVFSSFIDKV